jgi:uncharacterized membrane protein YhiD involved in acid resistance
MTINISLGSAFFLITGIGIIQWLLTTWVRSRLENSIRSEYEKTIEDYKLEIKTKERAEKVAKYLSLYFQDSQNFQELNQLSWELALWLPDHIYKNMTTAIKNMGGELDITKPTILDILIDTRKELLKSPGKLKGNDIIVHRKNISK